MTTLVNEALVETERLLRRWSRQQVVVASTLVLPILLLLTFDLVLSRTLGAVGGSEPLHGFVPLIAVAGAMYGAMGTAESLVGERENGLLRRFWSLPVQRFSGLLGRLFAECARAFVATVLVLVVGVILGLRFDHGVVGVLGVLVVPVIVVAGFTPLVVAVALSPVGRQAVQIFSIVVLVGMFFNSGFVAIDSYPGWLQPIVRAQPMSCAIEAMRGFLQGGATVTPLLQTIAWSVGMVAVFGALSVRGYRAAAEN
ncbi:ABC transporter permease [Nocardia sp. NPDC055321]